MSIPERLKSRKLWLAIGAFITFVANNQWSEAMGVVIAYLGLQGVQDTAKVYGEAKLGNIDSSTEVFQDEEEFDGTIVSGKEITPTEE